MILNDIEFEMLKSLQSASELCLRTMSPAQRAAADRLADGGLVDVWVSGELSLTDAGVLAVELEQQRRQRVQDAENDARKERTRKRIKEIAPLLLGAIGKVASFFFK